MVLLIQRMVILLEKEMKINVVRILMILIKAMQVDWVWASWVPYVSDRDWKDGLVFYCAEQLKRLFTMRTPVLHCSFQSLKGYGTWNIYLWREIALDYSDIMTGCKSEHGIWYTASLKEGFLYFQGTCFVFSCGAVNCEANKMYRQKECICSYRPAYFHGTAKKVNHLTKRIGEMLYLLTTINFIGLGMSKHFESRTRGRWHEIICCEATW